MNTRTIRNSFFNGAVISKKKDALPIEKKYNKQLLEGKLFLKIYKLLNN